MSRARIPACEARILLMEAQGLLANPTRRATAKTLAATIDALGFVQVDSINVVDRAHHITLGTRLEGYRDEHLTQLLARRSLFEHWTHDAAVIPTELFTHWKRRFRLAAQNPRTMRWLSRKIGNDPKAAIARVKRRLRRDGPLMTQDFEDDRSVKRGSWWDWSAPRATLEFLWRTGAVSIAGRRNFHKVYDLTERVFPDQHRLRATGPTQHLNWACSGALSRLGVAAPGELARFFSAVGPEEARAWCKREERAGRIVQVDVEDAQGGKLRRAFAAADWEERVSRCPSPPDGIRLLGPFDPVIRDRTRLLRRFGFEHHFEGFVPPPKRRWGYYVMPLLSADRFVGRIDPKLHRDRGVLEVKHVYWEQDVRPTRKLKRQLDTALEGFAKRIGASDVEHRG
jgi:uncharacterized protein YcaQ